MTKINSFKYLAACSFFFALCSSMAYAGSYQKSGEIKIGGDGGWDYLIIDGSHHLYLSQATRAVIVDTEKDQIKGEIASTLGVHGFTLAQDLGRGFISDGKEAKVAVFDLNTMKITDKISVGDNPDSLVYDPDTHKVFVFNGKSKTMSVLSGELKTKLATVNLPGKPEFSVVDPDAEQVYVNIEDKNEILAISTKSHHVISTWPIAPCEMPTGLAIDIVGKKLFAVCENQKLIAFDIASHKVISTLPIGSGADAVAYEPFSKKVFASAGEGKVTIARVGDKGQLTLDQELVTEPGARTVAIDPLSRKLYLPTAQFDGKKIEGHHPKIIPGSIKLLVYKAAD
jgi:DNA-binding beta-propeller fold protein YncE